MKMSKKEFFNYLGFDDNQYLYILNKCRGIGLADTERIIACVYTVVKCGFPLEEIEMLILKNPYFMLDNPSTLEKKLVSLGPDMAAKVLKDPLII